MDQGGGSNRASPCPLLSLPAALPPTPPMLQGVDAPLPIPDKTAAGQARVAQT